MGARPFFYAHAGGQIVFSNTLEALRLAPDVSAKLDIHFIGDFLLQSWCPDAERTAFLDIRRLPAGHALKYSNGELSVRRYATLPIEEPLFLKRREDYVEEFRDHLEQAIRDRLPAGPAGIFMSGGLDSTSVAAVANKVQIAEALQIRSEPTRWITHLSSRTKRALTRQRWRRTSAFRSTFWLELPLRRSADGKRP